MTVLAVAKPRPEPVAVPAAPFLVLGTVHGRAIEAPAGCLDDVLALIGHWTGSDPAATGCWQLNRDYSEPITLVVRPRPDRAPLTRRNAHLVRLRPATRYGGTLTMLCGRTLGITDAESIDIGRGMPCERCLAWTPLADCQDMERELTRSNDSSVTRC